MGNCCSENSTHSTNSKHQRKPKRAELIHMLTQKDEIIARQKAETDTMQKEIDKLNSRITKGHTMLQELRDNEQKLTAKNSRVSDDLRQLQEQARTKENELKDLKKENKKLKKRISKQDIELQNEKSICEKKIFDLQEEKSKLLTRLSALASAKLLDGNENIADLSDVNRPTKIAEQFSELYDNEWTDAFAYLTRDSKNARSSVYENVTRQGQIRSTCTEQEACKILLDILFKIYTESVKIAEEEIEKLISGLRAIHGGQEPPLELVRQFKDTRKKMYGEWSVETMETNCPTLATDIRRLLTGETDLHEKKIKDYVDKCLILCRLMAVQDPPVYIEQMDYQKDAKFNGNLYKQFTKSGPVVEFFVWPPLFLSKGGNLLSKGVAQGTSSSAKPGYENNKNQQNVSSPQTQAFASGQLNAISSTAKEEQNINPKAACETAQVAESDRLKLEAKEEEGSPKVKFDPRVKGSSVDKLKKIFTVENQQTPSSVSVSHKKSDNGRVNKAAFRAEFSDQPDPASEKKEITHEPVQTTHRPHSKDQISSQEKNGHKHISVLNYQSRN